MFVQIQINNIRMDIESLREYKILEYAIFDLLLAFIFVIIFSPLLSKIALKIGYKVPLKSWIFLTIPFSIFIHMLVGNMTIMTLNFLDLNGHYLLKLIVILLTFFGIKWISKVDKEPN